MVDWKQYQQYLEERLSPKRYTHSVNVSLAAEALAKRYGYADPEKARFAGLVHDICKEDTQEEQYALMMRSSLDVCAEERKAFKVWHGIAGAELLREKFGVTDEEVLLAVRYHTIGHAGMTMLEKIVYLADMISAERSYNGVEEMRRKTEESLESAMGYALEYSLAKLLKRQAWIPHHTVEAYNEYLDWLAATSHKTH